MNWGVVGEFATGDALLRAAQAARAAGYREIDAYSPFPVEGLAEAIGFRKNRVPLVTLLAGIAGGVGGYFMQWYSAVIYYPENIGGRPLNSWPSFIPVTFELTILAAAFGAFLGMLALNKLPHYVHPAFNTPEFARATRDRFFLCLRASAPDFNREHAAALLRDAHALNVEEVEE